MTNSEEIIYKFYLLQKIKKECAYKNNLKNIFNQKIITEEEVNTCINKAKLLENNYKEEIESGQKIEDSYIKIEKNSIENIKNIICDISIHFKQLIMNILISLKSNFKIPGKEIDKYLPLLISTNGKQIIEEGINNYYENNIIEEKLFHPKKYIMKILKYDNNNEESNNKIKIFGNKDEPLFNNEKKILVLEDGINEMYFINDDVTLLTSKKMFKNFKLINDLGFNLDIEEEKNTTKKLTMKILSNFERQKALSNKNVIEINDLIQINSDKSIIKKEEIKLFESLLDKHHNRVIFLQKLNEFRNTGKFLIPKEISEIIVNSFNIILNNVKRDNDMHCGKTVILLSQSYYTIENGKKKYLEKLILGNKLFKEEKFWEDLLNLEISREFQRLYLIEEKNLNIMSNIEGIRGINKEHFGNIIFGQIITICENMINFGLNREQVYKIIEPKMKSYQLNQDIVNNIKNMIEDKINEEIKINK